MSLKQEQLATELKNDLNEQLRTNMMDAMLLMQQAPSVQESETSTVTNDSLNSMSTASTLQTILTQMKTPQNELHALKSQPTTSDKNINPRTGKQWKRYCWTCGCCPHFSNYCPNKASGHQDDASFANRKGGSNKNCRPNTSS